MQRPLRLLRVRLISLSYAAVRWLLFFALGASNDLDLVTAAWCIDWSVPLVALITFLAYLLFRSRCAYSQVLPD